jgi:hypothetical protein
MSSPLATAIVGLCSTESTERSLAGVEIHRKGRILAEQATCAWWSDPALSALLGAEPAITVGLAVEPATFARIREANGGPRLADIPPDQDAREFELHFPGNIALDVLTTREPDGAGAIARYLAKFGEGIQQVEYRCADVDRATVLLKEKFALLPVYPRARSGADGTRINFFLVPTSAGGKVLIELYEVPDQCR